MLFLEATADEHKYEANNEPLPKEISKNCYADQELDENDLYFNLNAEEIRNLCELFGDKIISLYKMPKIFPF